MTDTAPASGVDLARAALAAARANAKNVPAQPQRKKPTRTRVSRTGGRDPMGLASAITAMMTERGWEPPEAGGSIIDQWPTIAPELVGKVAAERFEHDTGILHLRPASPAYGTQLRLHEVQMLRTIQEKTGSRSVRGLRILAPGGTPRAADTDTAGQPEPSSADSPQAPVRTREDGCPGYQDARAVVLEHRPPAPEVNPYVAEAMRRQEAALRAGRQPEDEHRDAVWAQQPTRPVRDSVEESLARARAYARQQTAGRTPRRAFDVA
jgi:predicted nucleic acid-binding Zn ribbon protein